MGSKRKRRVGSADEELRRRARRLVLMCGDPACKYARDGEWYEGTRRVSSNGEMDRVVRGGMEEDVDRTTSSFTGDACVGVVPNHSVAFNSPTPG